MRKPTWLVSFAKKRHAKAQMAPYATTPYSIQEKAYAFRQAFLWIPVLLSIGFNLQFPHHGMFIILALMVLWVIEPIPRLTLRHYWKRQLQRNPSKRSIRECSPR